MSGRTVKLPGGIVVGIDLAPGEDKETWCEVRRESDGSIAILDIYEVPTKPRAGRIAGR